MMVSEEVKMDGWMPSAAIVLRLGCSIRCVLDVRRESRCHVSRHSPDTEVSFYLGGRKDKGRYCTVVDSDSSYMRTGPPPLKI